MSSNQNFQAGQIHIFPNLPCRAMQCSGTWRFPRPLTLSLARERGQKGNLNGSAADPWQRSALTLC